MSTMTLTEVRDRLRDECAMVEGDATKYPECAYHVSASVLEDLVEALNHHLAQPAQAVDVGWKEAAIAWNVCASIHREYAKGKDPLFSTRQKDFVKHHKDARTRALSGEKAGPVADGWQPIETAPTTDEAVMTWSVLDEIQIAHRHQHNPAFGSSKPYWVVVQGRSDYTIHPTHWQPLPASPTPDKEGL